MSTLYGELTCPSCALKTRFAETFQIAGAPDFLMLGSKIESINTATLTSEEAVQCDYCEAYFHVYTRVSEGIVSDFAADASLLTSKSVKENSGLLFEKEKKLRQFNETWSTPWSQHPKLTGETFKVRQKKWTITAAYKKENIEKDTIVRSSIETGDVYFYEVSDGKVKKWISVTTGDKDNAKLTIEPPVVKEHEMLHEIVDELGRSEIIFEREAGENMTLTGIKMLSGVSLLLHSKDENGMQELEANLFGETLDEVLEKFEDLYER
jgi:hypothetical protein